MPKFIGSYKNRISRGNVRAELPRELLPVEAAVGRGIAIGLVLTVIAAIAPRPEAQTDQRGAGQASERPLTPVADEHGRQQRPDADPADDERRQIEARHEAVGRPPVPDRGADEKRAGDQPERRRGDHVTATVISTAPSSCSSSRWHRIALSSRYAVTVIHAPKSESGDQNTSRPFQANGPVRGMKAMAPASNISAVQSVK